MIKKYWWSLTISIGLLCLCITGCVFASETYATLTVVKTKTNPSATSSLPTPTTLVSPTETPNMPVQIVLPAVTMSPQEAHNALLELLKTNGNCTGKCIAGIRPDEMTVQQTVDQMAQWGMLTIGEDDQGRTFINNIDQDPLYEELNVDLAMGTWTKKIKTSNKVSFHMPSRSGGKEFLGADVWLENREAWRAFRLDNLLKAYGTPSFVGFMLTTRTSGLIAYTIEIQYEQMNLAVGIGALGNNKGGNILLCPSKDPHSLGITINFERPLTEVQQFYPVSWQALTGTDLNSFYQKFTGGSTADICVTTTFKQIEALDPTFR